MPAQKPAQVPVAHTQTPAVQPYGLGASYAQPLHQYIPGIATLGPVRGTVSFNSASLGLSG